MSDILKVKDISVLNALKNHEQGEIAYCEDTSQYMMYSNEDGWRPVNIEMNSEGGPQISLYELNRSIIEQACKDFSDEDWNKAEIVIDEWMNNHSSKFYMLYGKESGYFTVFQKKNKIGEFDNFFNALKECMNNVGNVKSLEPTEDYSAIEIWATNNDILTCFYLFDYESGVVTYNG